MKQYETYMKECFELARQAEGKTSPNPLVGCIVLNKKGKIISNGFHAKCGENHAERDALLKVTPEDCAYGTLIVNLEPCSHFGKTPPCADLIIEYGIKKVVIAMRDVNPVVSGNGIAKLKAAGIEVVEGVLEDQARKLNEIFITNMTEKRTFVALKTAATLDGKIAASSGSSKWITSDAARSEVKKIRARYDAILTSSATVIADNPTMEHNIKIILDRELKTDFENAKVYKSGNIFVFYDENCQNNEILNSFFANPRNDKNSITFIKTPLINEKLDIEFILKKLYELKIMSVLVEAGGILNGSFLTYADKIYHFIAPKITGDNNSKSAFDGKKISQISESLNFRFDEIQTFEPDILVTYYPEKQSIINQLARFCFAHNCQQ